YQQRRPLRPALPIGVQGVFYERGQRIRFGVWAVAGLSLLCAAAARLPGGGIRLPQGQRRRGTGKAAPGSPGQREEKGVSPMTHDTIAEARYYLMVIVSNAILIREQSTSTDPAKEHAEKIVDYSQRLAVLFTQEWHCQ